MDRSVFARSPAGQLAPTFKGQWGFVPNDLPPTLDANTFVSELAGATQALGELNGILRTLPDPYLLIQPMQAREALTSSSMEGTFTTVDRLLLAEAGFSGAEGSSDTREVRNYSVALRKAIASLKELPLSLRTLRNAHRDLLSGVTRSRGAMVRAGEFKAHQNWIGAATIEAARFVPTPPNETLDCLSSLERYLHRPNRDETPALIDAALVHYQFETIHPFADGNGRVGRILIPVMLFERNALVHPALFVSPVLERRKEEYIDRMYRVSLAGEWNAWIRFFLSVVATSCGEILSAAEELLAIREQYRRSLQQAGRSALLLSIVDRLFTNPIFSTPQLAEHLKITYRSAQRLINMILDAGLIEEVSGVRYPKYFAAREIMRIISKENNP